MFIVIQFKEVLKSLKYTDSSTQLLSYIKLVLISTISFLVPLISLMLFNTTYDAPLSDVTDYTASVVGDAVNYGSDFVENSKEVLNDGVSTLSNGVENVQNSVNNAVVNVSETVGNISETVGDSVTKVSDQINDGISRVTPSVSASQSQV